MNVWDNNHTLSEYYVCDAPIIQICPSDVQSNLYIFSSDGYVHHVDGYDFKLISSTKISEHKLVCVEEVLIRKARGFMTSDTEGNLFIFDSTFEASKKLDKHERATTSIQCIGRNRVIISRPVSEKEVRFEVISPYSGNQVSMLDVSGITKIRDMDCPNERFGKNEGWIIAASSKSIATINFKMSKLELVRLIHFRPGFYIDEIACDIVEQKVVGKNVPEDTSIIEDKCSTISWEFGVKTFTEFNNLYIKGKFGKINKHIDLGEEEIISKNLHFPEGRICCGTNDGRLIVVDFRRNSIRFIFDA